MDRFGLRVDIDHDNHRSGNDNNGGRHGAGNHSSAGNYAGPGLDVDRTAGNYASAGLDNDRTAGNDDNHQTDHDHHDRTANDRSSGRGYRFLSRRDRRRRLTSRPCRASVAHVSDTAGPAAHYDEFGLFHENIAEFGLDVAIPPVVRRHVELADGRSISALSWGEPAAAAEVVFVHGGAQNAHTWDTVALALGRPALAVDLPGHGHSSWRSDGEYSPANLADDVAAAVRRHAPEALLVVGMSLGGLTSMMLANRHPDLVRSLVMVDITPGVNQKKAKAIIDFVNGPQSFTSFDDLLARTIEFNPTRSEPSLRREILHNAHPIADGSWQWNYDRTNRLQSSEGETSGMPEADVISDEARNPLWDDFASVGCPLSLVRGSLSPVVDDADVAEATRLQPNMAVHLVDGAGHSVQGDRPVELAAIITSKLS